MKKTLTVSRVPARGELVARRDDPVHVGRVTAVNRTAGICSISWIDHDWQEFGVPIGELQIAEIWKTPDPGPIQTAFIRLAQAVWRER